jgi:hypothetical protein
MADLWEQQSDEPDESYGRFLIYRGLGPGRSIASAYAHYLNTFRNATPRPKTPQVPGHWSDDSAKWKWIDRAHAWDVSVLRTYGERLVVRFIGSLDKLAEKTAEALAKDNCRPKRWADVLSAINVLAAYVTPDAAKALQPAADDAEPKRAADRASVE